MLNIWVDWRHKSGLPLPIVLPFLVVHGPERWTVDNNFASLFGESGETFANLIPNFSWQVKDLGATRPEALAEEQALRAVLMCLKYFFDPHVERYLVDIVACSSQRDTDFTISLLRYILQSRSPISESGLQRALAEARPEDEERIMASLPQKWFEEGRQEGWQKGQQEGWQQGQQEGRTQEAARFFRQMLKAKFGILPDSVEQRISNADAATLEHWGKRIFESATIEDVFAA